MASFDGIIDVYDENELDLQEAWHRGVRAILHQTTRGLYKRATKYAARKKAAMDMGFLWAGYHLLSAEDPEKQLEFFLSVEDGGDPHVGLAIDWEPSKKGMMSYEQLRSFVQLFNAKMKPRYADRYPILYGGKAIRETSGIRNGDPLLAKCPLWYVRYTHGPLEIPAKTWINYTLWQFDDENRKWGAPPPDVLPGADWNRFDGDLDALKRAWPFSGPSAEEIRRPSAGEIRPFSAEGADIGMDVHTTIHGLVGNIAGNIAAAVKPDPRLVTVLYATNRQILETDRPFSLENFTAKRSDTLTFGSADVRVPENRKPGQVNRPWKLALFGITIYKQAESDKKHFVLKRLGKLSRSEFCDAIKSHGDKSALIFVHGYCNTVEDAIFRLTQIVFDTNYDGIPIAFCWPSAGSWTAYDYDRESAAYSRDPFLELVSLIQEQSGATKIMVLAHSMGNQIVTDAIAHAATAPPLSIRELIMAAPDVDRDVFKSLAGKLKAVTKGLTLYASSADKALLASKVKAGDVPRAGDVPAEGPLIIEGIDTIDVTAVGDDMFALNHGTYSSDRSVIDDVGRIVITETRPPHVRTPQLRRVPERSEHPIYWRYP